MSARSPGPAPTANRRQFLRGLGGALMALPVLPSLLVGEARAQAAPRPKRLICVFSGNGQVSRSWYPADAAVRWTADTAAAREVALRDVSAAPDAHGLPGGGFSDVLGPELRPFAEKLLLVRGLDLVHSGGHFPANMLGAWGETSCGGPTTYRATTLDQVLHARLVAQAPHLRHLHLKGSAQLENAALSVTGALTGVNAQMMNRAMLDQLFGAVAGAAGRAPEPSAEERRLLRRRHLVDRVLGEYNTLRQSPRLSGDDRTRLDEHVALLSDLEGRLGDAAARPVAVDCRAPEFVDDPGAWDALVRNQVDAAVAAVRCDVSRVVNVMLSTGSDNRVFDALGVNRNHHDLSHERTDAAVRDLARINRWYAQRFAELLARLDVVEEPDTGRTYLDNSVVLWGNEYGMNQWHEEPGMQVLLAGSAGGYFRTGRYVDLRRKNAQGGYIARKFPWEGNLADLPDDREKLGRPYNALMVTLLDAMGQGDFAGQGFGEYHPDQNWGGQYDLAAARQPLSELG